MHDDYELNFKQSPATNLVLAAQFRHVEGINPRSVEVILGPHFLPERYLNTQKTYSSDCTLGPSCSSLLFWRSQNYEASKNRPRAGASLGGQEYLKDVVIMCQLSMTSQISGTYW